MPPSMNDGGQFLTSNDLAASKNLNPQNSVPAYSEIFGGYEEPSTLWFDEAMKS